MNNVDFLEFTTVEPCFERPYSGVQLMPNSYTEYVCPFDTYGLMPFLKSNVDFFILDCFGNKTNVTEHITIQGGNIVISQIPYNIDRRVVLNAHIKDLSVNLYSNIIKITNVRDEYTVRLEYGCCNGQNLSTQIQMFEHHSNRNTEIDTYTRVSSNNQVSFLPSNVKYYVYQVELMNVETILKLIDVFQNKDVYFDNEKVNLFSIPEIDELDYGVYMATQKIEVTKLGLKDNLILLLGSNKDEYIITNKDEKIRINGR